MAVLVVAEQIALARNVALKVLAPELVGSAEAVERFVREARAVAKLESAHIARVLRKASGLDGSEGQRRAARVVRVVDPSSTELPPPDAPSGADTPRSAPPAKHKKRKARTHHAPASASFPRRTNPRLAGPPAAPRQVSDC
jgi:serine/threonine protein kinase